MMGTKLDWEKLLAEQEWLQQTDLPMIVSPDFDGLLCALLMSHYRNWRLCGFWTGNGCYQNRNGFSKRICR